MMSSDSLWLTADTINCHSFLSTTTFDSILWSCFFPEICFLSMLLRLGLNCTRLTSCSLYTSLRLKCTSPSPLRFHSQTYNRLSLSGLPRGFTSTSTVKATTPHVRRLGGAAIVASVGLGIAVLSKPILCDRKSNNNSSIQPYGLSFMQRDQSQVLVQPSLLQAHQTPLILNKTYLQQPPRMDLYHLPRSPP